MHRWDYFFPIRVTIHRWDYFFPIRITIRQGGGLDESLGRGGFLTIRFSTKVTCSKNERLSFFSSPGNFFRSTEPSSNFLHCLYAQAAFEQSSLRRKKRFKIYCIFFISRGAEFLMHGSGFELYRLTDEEA